MSRDSAGRDAQSTGIGTVGRSGVAVAALAGGLLAYRALARRGSADSGGGEFLQKGESGESAESETDADTDASTVTSAVTVMASADEAYETWRDPETQARVFSGFADVTEVDENRWRWDVSAPLGRTLSWETRALVDDPGELVRWEAVEGPALIPEGSVRFSPAPADRGTEVRLELRVDPPGGSVGRAAMERLGVLPKALTNKVLYRYRSLVEAGEMPTLEGNPSGRGRGDLI